MPSLLFEPMAIGEVALPNRLVVAPMCQYSASDGSATDCISSICRSSHIRVPAWSSSKRQPWNAADALLMRAWVYTATTNEATLERALHAARRLGGPTRFGIQLAHAGRKVRRIDLGRAALRSVRPRIRGRRYRRAPLRSARAGMSRMR